MTSTYIDYYAVDRLLEANNYENTAYFPSLDSNVTPADRQYVEITNEKKTLFMNVKFSDSYDSYRQIGKVYLSVYQRSFLETNDNTKVVCDFYNSLPKNITKISNLDISIKTSGVATIHEKVAVAVKMDFLNKYNQTVLTNFMEYPLKRESSHYTIKVHSITTHTSVGSNALSNFGFLDQSCTVRTVNEIK